MSEVVYVRDISGTALQLDSRGYVIALISGAVVNVSGMTVEIRVSGEVVLISGEAVRVSGQAVRISGEAVRVSGEVVDVSDRETRVLGVARISGQTVRVSGETVSANVSGNVVQISGQVVRVSGEIVNTSGQVALEYGTTVRTFADLNPTNSSGGSELGSGVIFAATLRSASGNALMRVGGTGANAPTSGVGVILYGGDALDVRVDNFNRVRVWALTSGQAVSAIGIAP